MKGSCTKDCGVLAVLRHQGNGGCLYSVEPMFCLLFSSSFQNWLSLKGSLGSSQVLCKSILNQPCSLFLLHGSLLTCCDYGKVPQEGRRNLPGNTETYGVRRSSIWHPRDTCLLLFVVKVLKPPLASCKGGEKAGQIGRVNPLLKNQASILR